MLDINVNKYVNSGVIRTLKSIAAEEGLAGEYEFLSEVQVYCTVRGSVSLRVPISLVWMVHPAMLVALLPSSTPIYYSHFFRFIFGSDTSHDMDLRR